MRTFSCGRIPLRRRLVVTLKAAFALGVLAFLFPTATHAFVYWGDFDNNTVGRANLDGSGVQHNFIGGATYPCGVAVDAGHLYWGNNGANSGTTIGRADLAGRGVDQTFVSGANAPCGVAVNESHVYWANNAGANSTIGRANLDGSAAENAFIPDVSSPCGVAVDGQHVYWVSRTIPARIGRANLDGTGVDRDFITGLGNSACGIAVDGSHVYWGGFTTQAVGRANLDGTGVDESFITGGSFPCGVAVDGAHVYWGNAGADTIGRAGLDGSDSNESFVAGAAKSCGIAVDSLIPATTSISASRTDSFYGQPLAFTATVSGSGVAPSGTIQFAVNGTDEGGPSGLDAGGRGTFTPPYLLDVGDTVSAVYSGDATYGPNAVDFHPSILPAPTTTQITVTPNPVVSGGSFDVAVGVTNTDTAVTPFGSVQFLINGASFGAPIDLHDDGRLAARVIANVPAGDYQITAAYRDDTAAIPDFGESDASVVQRVTSTPSPPPPASPAPPPLTVSTKDLAAMTAVLIKALKARGFSAFSAAVQRFTATTPGTLTQNIYANLAGKSSKSSGGKRVLLATGHHTFNATGTSRMRLRLTPNGRRMMNRAKRLSVLILTRFKSATRAIIVTRQRLTVTKRGRRARGSVSSRPRPRPVTLLHLATGVGDGASRRGTATISP
jgi:hypothetical protein